MSSENSKTSKRNVLILKLTDKLDLRRGEKVLLYQILLYMEKHKKLIQQQ